MAGPTAVARVLHEAGFHGVEVPTKPHPDKVRHFERARPNQLWQTDLFTFILKRQNRRVYLVANRRARWGISSGWGSRGGSAGLAPPGPDCPAAPGRCAREGCGGTAGMLSPEVLALQGR